MTTWQPPRPLTVVERLDPPQPCECDILGGADALVAMQDAVKLLSVQQTQAIMCDIWPYADPHASPSYEASRRMMLVTDLLAETDDPNVLTMWAEMLPFDDARGV